MVVKTWHRVLFIAAGLYNVVWAGLSSLYPQWFFHIAEVEPLNHPVIFACLAMVIGVYGLLYLEVARRPRDGFAIAAVGLLGKVLGPLGWVYMFLSGEWPLASIVLIATNDLIWWLPFCLYLRSAWPEYVKSFQANSVET